MTMKTITINNTIVFCSIILIATLMTTVSNSELYSYIITNNNTVKVNNDMPSSVISPFSIKSVLASISLNKTGGLSAYLSSPATTIDNMSIDVKSQHSIHGTAGQFVKVKGVITNNNPNDTTKSGIAYISIVDLKDKVPVDLEDWSVAKGLYIPGIKGGQALPIEWSVRLVKAGSYTIDMLFNPDGNLNTPPIISSRITMDVLPKINLNPGNVLPVAFGVPAIVIITLGYIGFRRGKKTGIYK